MNEVGRVLSGRDGRAYLQELMVRRSGIMVQITLNIPGFPKKMEGDRTLIDAVGQHIEKRVLALGWDTVYSVFIDNGAGSASLLEIIGAEIKALKKIGMDIEDLHWGGILDVDVLGINGALHRRDLGRADRKCFVCGGSAKICAREQRHEIDYLRKIAAELIKTGMKERFNDCP